MKKLPLIAAHQGCYTGNIPCNNPIAYEAALMSGADIVEIDVSRCADGTLFVFHPGQEKKWLSTDLRIPQLTAEEVKQLRFVDVHGSRTNIGVSLLDDVLEQLKGRCIVNVDKFFDHPAEIAAAIRKHGMQDQVLVKTDAGEEWFRTVEEVAPDLPYMVFTWDNDDFSETLLKRNLRYLGTEAYFSSESAQTATPEYIDWMHRNNLKIWYNAIVCNCNRPHSAGHNDNIAVAGDPDTGWGWMIDRGIDMIQTDWCAQLHRYMHQSYRPKITL